ncbi:MAG: hypothetical protein GVY19_09745 [Bacteroidetes bacterium]|jgi:hypothetical protein|nr:hypothetical protein [Bacteroidota bacterium]
MNRIYLWLTLFGIAFGYLECAVVVYLREILYPEGFSFPLVPISSKLAITEIGREAATLIMLVGIGILTGRTKTERFGMFLFSFAIWDIFYYVFLKVLLDWPSSLLTWDILFLIPTTWTGPVISPILLSLVMIAFALVISRAVTNDPMVKIIRREWLLLISGSIICILAFVWDYSKYVLKIYDFSTLFHLNKDQIFEITTNYVPVQFNWLLYGLGLATIVAGVVWFERRNKIVWKK